jgi:hypothetical protein
LAPYLPGRPIGSRGCRNGRSRAVKCFFSGMVGCGAHLPTCTPDPQMGRLWVRFGGAFFGRMATCMEGLPPPLVGAFGKNSSSEKNIFFTQAGLVCGCRRPSAGLQSTFNQHPPCPISTNAPWGFCRLKRAPRRPWKVRGSTTMCALSAFQVSEMGLTGDVG